MRPIKYINEKFTDESDPIKDMGIGLYVKRSFNTKEEFYEWLYTVAQYILNVKDIKDIITNTGSHEIFFTEYWEKLNYYYQKYITIKDYSADSEFQSGPFRDLINKKSIKENLINNSRNIYHIDEKLSDDNMKKRKVKKIKEGYGAGFSMNSFRGGMGGTSRGGFGGANNLGGPNMMYTYEIKPLNHTLEQLPTLTPDQTQQVQIGSVVKANAVRSNATPEIKEIKGIVRKIIITNSGAIKYYVVQDEATQNMVKVDPLTVTLVIPEPVNYFFDATDNVPSKRKERIKAAMKENPKIVAESIEELKYKNNR